MNTVARRQKLIQQLELEGSVSIVEQAGALGVSSMTVRRDLAKLAEEGMVTLGHGGATLNKGALFERNMAIKQGQHRLEKEKIARAAIEYIEDGDSIFLDAGTTVCEIAKLLVNRRDIVVLTNSLLVANVLSSSESIRQIMCPGTFRARSMCYIGQSTSEFVTRYKVDVCFLSAAGVDLAKGVSVPDEVDGATKRAVALHAEKTICVADSSKFGKTLFYNVCSLDDIDVLVTDDCLSEGELRQFRKSRVNVVIAS